MSIIEAAPPKIKPRTADSIILEAIEASRKAVNGYEGDAIRAVLESATPGQRAAVTKKLKGYGKGNVRTEIFLYTCGTGHPIEGPFVEDANRVANGLRTILADKLPATCFDPHPHPWYNAYTVTKMLQEQVKGVSFYTASLAVQEHFPMLFCPVEVDPTPEPVNPVCGGSPEVTAPLVGEPAPNPLTGIDTPLVGDMAPARKMTASDYDVNLDDVRAEGMDLRYFGIAQRAIRDGALEVLASSDFGCSVHGPGRDTYGDTDDDERVDFMAWLRIIRSPIRLSARNFAQAWDEFILDCREGSPVTFKAPLPPLDDDDRDAMTRVYEETCRWSPSSSSRTITDSDGTSRCETPEGISCGDRHPRATETCPRSTPSDTGSSARRRPSGAGTTDTTTTDPIGLMVDGIPIDFEPFDPEATILDMPVDPSRGYCWGTAESPLAGIQGDAYDDYPNGDGDFSPWMRPAYDPMTLDDYEAMKALGLAF